VWLGDQGLDEAARTATRLVDGVDQFYVASMPDGTRRLLVELVDDANNTQIALAPLPR
jgi:hypothetical protein